MPELSKHTPPLDYWVRVINDAISELARSETRDRSTLPLRVTLAAIAHHIESGAVMPTPLANPDALHCGCCGIELTPESETFFGEVPLCKSCSKAAVLVFDEANRSVDKASPQWQAEWPEGTAGDRQWWWLYARCWGDAEPKLYPVQVRRIANGTAWIATGQFVYPQDIKGPALWQRATPPELPNAGATFE